MRSVLAISVLLVTAGCLGAAPNSGNSPDSTTVSPAEGFPPGVTDAGVDNASALLGAHADAVERTGYAFTGNATNVRETADGTTAEQSSAYGGRVSGQHARIHLDIGNSSTDVWLNDSVQLLRTERGDRVRYHERRSDGITFDPTGNYLRSVLRAANFTVTDRYVEDGRTYLALEATDLEPDARESFTSVDARLVVDLDGRVHSFDSTVGFDVNDLREKHYSFEVTSFDVDSIERPDWADRAAETVTADVRLDDGDDYVVFEHRGGDTLPPGTTVEIVHGGETNVFTLDREVSAGERFYVAYPTDGSDPVLAFEEPSGDYERIEGSYEVTVTGPNGGSVVNAGFAVHSATATATTGSA